MESSLRLTLFLQRHRLLELVQPNVDMLFDFSLFRIYHAHVTEGFGSGLLDQYQQIAFLQNDIRIQTSDEESVYDYSLCPSHVSKATHGDVPVHYVGREHFK
jgi:hypothetical protein